MENKKASSKPNIDLLEVSKFCLKSAISASAAANFCWVVASASTAFLTRDSKFCSSRAEFRLWTWAHALFSAVLASEMSLQIISTLQVEVYWSGSV